MSHINILPALRRAMLIVTVTCLLGLLAQVSHQSHNHLRGRHDIERPEIDDDSDDQDVGYAQAEGQSRAFGGQEQVREGDAFPWFNILFRNPAATLNDYARPFDGYMTGYAIEVEHNVFLGHREAIRRASHYHGKTLAMQGWQHLGIHRRYVIPYADKIWGEPKDGSYRGVVRLLAELGPQFGLYRIRIEKYPFVERAAAARSELARSGSRVQSDGLPPFNWPDNKDAYTYEYPRLNKNTSLEFKVCYMFAMASPNITGKFNDHAYRKFSRWPVKLLHCEQDDCVFKFDDTPRTDIRIIKEDVKIRGSQCGTWQDVGAPIMCGTKGFPSKTFTEYYQRRHLMLSFVVMPPRPLEPGKVSCYERVHAMRLADHVDRIEQEIDKLKKSGGL